MYNFKNITREEIGVLVGYCADFYANTNYSDINTMALSLYKDEKHIGYVLYSNMCMGLFTYEDGKITKRYVLVGKNGDVRCMIDGYYYSVNEEEAMAFDNENDINYILHINEDNTYTYVITYNNYSVARMYDGNIINDEHVKELAVFDKDISPLYSYLKVEAGKENPMYSLIQLIESANIIDFAVKVNNPNSQGKIIDSGLLLHEGAASTHYIRVIFKNIFSKEFREIKRTGKDIITKSEFLLKYVCPEFPPHFIELTNGNFEQYNELLGIYEAVIDMFICEEEMKLTKNKDN